MSDLNKRSAVIERYVESAKIMVYMNVQHDPEREVGFHLLGVKLLRAQATKGKTKTKKQKKDSPKAVTIWNKQRAILEYFQDVPIP